MHLPETFCSAGCIPQEVIDGKNHKVPDSMLRTTSYWAGSWHGAASSRLHSQFELDVTAGAWCAGDQDIGNDYIVVLYSPYYIVNLIIVR